MPFTRKFCTLLQKSDGCVIMKNSNNSIEMQNFDANFELISSKEVIDSKYSLVDTWFDINENNSIYGLINTQKNSLMYLYINNKVTIKNTLLTYDSNLFSIQFPYIKCINSTTHIIYYLSNNNNTNRCTLTHHYKEGNYWIKNEIDTTDSNILTNFVVIWEKSSPIIFYFKIINGYEELFSSIFDLTSKTWCKPKQITNSGKFKVYLSAIRCDDGHCHITYSENNSNKYYCRYINICIEDNRFMILNDKIISKSIACTFPNVLQNNELLYIQWIENDSLHYCISHDLGENWSKPSLDENSSNCYFNSYSYKANNKQLNAYAIYSIDNSLNILGINK